MASDQDRFDTAYDAFRDLADDLYDIDLSSIPYQVSPVRMQRVYR